MTTSATSGAADEIRSILIGAARNVAPVLRQEADQAAADSRLTGTAAAALREAGLLRLGIPRQFDGYAVDPAICLAVTSEVALACPSSAWVVGLNYLAQHIAAFFGERVRQELWGESSDVPMCASFNGVGLAATRVEGGQVVSGRWPWASGCHDARWAPIGISIVDGAGAVTARGIAVVPMADLSIENTWDMVGMRGTGSDTLVAEGIFIPDHRIRPFADLVAGAGEGREPLYRIPIGSMMVMMVGPMLGIARAVFGQTMDIVTSGKAMPMSTHRQLADSPSVQATLADAANLIDSAELHLMRSADAMITAARAGVEPDLTARTRTRMDAGYAVRCLRDAVQLLLSVGGASNFARTTLVMRYWHDLETASKQPTLSEGLTREMYGRALVGNHDPVSLLV
jgi:3-hydroxy-9,10-secoandrosta-1,3,5(10)-triene-9,17-dione monooxygenase